VIKRRIGRNSVGFNASVSSPNWGHDEDSQILDDILPEDLIKYGLIPEFVGRLPIICTLHELDKEALVQILTEPTDALVKQYLKMFEFEGVSLKFTSDALETIAEKALERKIGARGLRLITEDLMLDVMYELPSTTKVKEFLVTREMVENKEVVFKLLEKAG
jgi:ATP-dependent Clp protease ATP-binding subunit ClpX